MRKDKLLSQNSEGASESNAGAWLKMSILCGIGMTVATVLLWFLLSRTAKNVGSVILISTLVLLAIDALILLALRNAHKFLKIFMRVFLVLINAVVLLCATVYSIAPTQLFYPHFDEASYNTLKTRPNTEELTFKTNEGNISGWMLHNAEDGAPLVVYFCGNGENASTRVLKLMDGNLLKTFTGYNIAVLDYPGYGKTDGSPSEASFKKFGLAAYDALAQRPDINKDRIVLFGYSIGTGVADYVASERKAAGLVLMAPYADGYDLFNGFVNVFHGPARLLVAFPMESIKFAEKVPVKPLILASKDDKMVSYDSSMRLSGAFPEGCTFKTFEGIGHNDFWGSEDAFSYIKQYLAEVKG